VSEDQISIILEVFIENEDSLLPVTVDVVVGTPDSFTLTIEKTEEVPLVVKPSPWALYLPAILSAQK